ncbi:MAG: CHAP domain-containing protein [Clostridia bacterium]|nr:CHAP domain-containing protein [Clostridia bacterium]
MKKISERITAVLLCVALLICPFALNVSATSKSSDEAIDWVKSNLGNTFGTGYCVDLICAYYQFLGESSYLIPASSYITVNLPAGWTRTQGGIPQKGDILIYTNSEIGHVAIYESDYSTYHQNWSNQLYVTNYTGYYAWKNYWGCIHPNFEGVSATSQTGTADSSSGLQQTANSSSASQGSDINIAEMINLFIKLATLCVRGLNIVIRIIRNFA